jgi:hypothetical protein
MQDGTHYSGSTAFNNAVRQRLTLEAAPREKGDTGEGQPPRTLKVAKSNYGPLLEKTLWYCGATISNMSHETPTSAAQAQRFSKACIAEAVRAASVGIPITAQARIPEAIIGEITKTISRRPKDAEVKNELAAAALAGQLVYQRGTNKARAGYYPADKELAKVLSRRTKPPLLQRKDDAS